MKKYYMIALILALNVACCLWNDLHGYEFSGKADYERNVDETYPIAEGVPIEVLHSMGNLTITVWEKREVALKARIEVEGDDAEKFGSRIRIDATGEGKLFRIETVFPDGEWKDISYGVRLDLVIPADHHLKAENSFGSITATGPQAGIDVDASCGSLEIEGVRGAMKLAASFGQVSVRNSSGETVIKGNSGSVEVDNLFGGNLDISNNFGQVKVKDIAGDLTVRCGSGKISAKNVAGSVRSGGSFGKQDFENIGGSLEVSGENSPVEAEKIGGPAEIETTFGSVTLKGAGGGATLALCNGTARVSGIRGDVDIKNEFGSTDVKEVSGNCRIRTCNGGVDVEAIKGNLDVENAFGSVNAAGVGGSISAETSNGNIKASGLSYSSGEKGKGNGFTLESTFGLIEIALPDPPSFKLTASTTFGSIKSDFDLGHINKGMSSQKAKCVLGKGLAEIKLTTSNGGIKIKKD